MSFAWGTAAPAAPAAADFSAFHAPAGHGFAAAGSAASPRLSMTLMAGVAGDDGTPYPTAAEAAAAAGVGYGQAPHPAQEMSPGEELNELMGAMAEALTVGHVPGRRPVLGSAAARAATARRAAAVGREAAKRSAVAGKKRRAPPAAPEDEDGVRTVTVAPVADEEGGGVGTPVRGEAGQGEMGAGGLAVGEEGRRSYRWTIPTPCSSARKAANPAGGRHSAGAPSAVSRGLGADFATAVAVRSKVTGAASRRIGGAAAAAAAAAADRQQPAGAARRAQHEAAFRQRRAAQHAAEQRAARLARETAPERDDPAAAAAAVMPAGLPGGRVTADLSRPTVLLDAASPRRGQRHRLSAASPDAAAGAAAGPPAHWGAEGDASPTAWRPSVVMDGAEDGSPDFVEAEALAAVGGVAMPLSPCPRNATNQMQGQYTGGFAPPPTPACGGYAVAAVGGPFSQATTPTRSPLFPEAQQHAW